MSAKAKAVHEHLFGVISRQIGRPLMRTNDDTVANAKRDGAARPPEDGAVQIKERVEG